MIRDSYTCSSCCKTSFPSFILADKGPRAGKLVAQCPNPECLRVDNSIGPEHFNAGVAAIPEEGREQGQGWAGKRQVIVDTQAVSVTPKPQLSRVGATLNSPVVEHDPRAVPSTQAVLQPLDVMDAIEQRTVALAVEEAKALNDIATLKARILSIKAERKRYEKMLAAGRREQARAEVTMPDAHGPS